MDPVTVLAALNGALSLANTLLPVVEQYRKDGVISADDQAKVKAAYESLRTRADGQFAGAAWQPSTEQS